MNSHLALPSENAAAPIPVRRLLGVVIAVLCIVASLLGTQGVASAQSRPNFDMPFTCGQTGWLASTWDAHVPSVYNIDFNRSPDDGQPVRASESGVVASPAYTGSSSNPIGIDHDGGGIRSGWATLYLHMRNTVPNGTRVNKGDVIGYVSNVGAPGGIHLHYEQRLNWVSQPVVFSNWSAPYNSAMKTGLGVGVPASQNCPAPPAAPAWAAEFVGQAAFLDAGLSQGWDLAGAYPGQEGFLRFQLRNTGSRTWTSTGSNPVLLGTAEARDRSSGLFMAGAWHAPNRPTLVTPSSVPPGAIGTFVFKVRVPAGAGNMREHFQLVAESAAWFGPVVWRDFGRPAHSATFVDQSAFLDAGLTRPWDLSTSHVGQVGYLRFRVRNTGAVTWSASGPNPVLLGATSPIDRSSPLFVAGSWPAPNRAAFVSPSTVAPGAVGTFVFRVTIPPGTGSIREHFQVVSESAAWFGPVMWRDLNRLPAPNRRPIGEIVNVAVVDRKLSVSGYAIDPDRDAPTSVTVSISGVGSFRVNASRRWSELPRRVPGFGDDHAFLFERDGLPAGTRDVCVTTHDLAGGPSTPLGCRSVVVK